jgi:hypothetical protein
MLSVDPSARWVLNPNLQSFLNFSLIAIVFLIFMISIGVFTGLIKPVVDRIRDSLVAPAINELLRENPDFLSERVDKLDRGAIAAMVNQVLRTKPNILSEYIQHTDIELLVAAVSHLIANNPDLMKDMLTGLDRQILMESVNRAERPLVMLLNELCEKQNLLGSYNLRCDAGAGNQVQLATPVTVRFKQFVKEQK